MNQLPTDITLTYLNHLDYIDLQNFCAISKYRCNIINTLANYRGINYRVDPVLIDFYNTIYELSDEIRKVAKSIAHGLSKNVWFIIVNNHKSDRLYTLKIKAEMPSGYFKTVKLPKSVFDYIITIIDSLRQLKEIKLYYMAEDQVEKATDEDMYDEAQALSKQFGDKIYNIINEKIKSLLFIN